MLTTITTRTQVATTVVVIDPATGISVALDDAHPNYPRIIQVLADPEATLAQVEAALSPLGVRPPKLSEWISVEHGVTMIGGHPVTTALGRAIADAHERGDAAWMDSLVAFTAKLADNPSANVRARLWRWVEASGFELSASGDIIGYKGLSDGHSICCGVEEVTVDDVAHIGYIPNPVGARIVMDRSLVRADPRANCHIGLHVGTRNFARDFARHSIRPMLATLHVDPADVVSVPSGGRKMRVCAYVVTECEVL